MGQDCRLNSGPIADYNVGINEDRPGHAVPPALGSRPSIHSIRRGSTGLSRFPGCPVTQRLHGHHVRHWAEGGETSLDNLVLLCPTHHRLVHKGGFDVQRLDDGAFRFTTLSYTAEVKMFGTDQNAAIHLYTHERACPEARSARGRGVSNNARARQRPWISAVSARADSRAA